MPGDRSLLAGSWLTSIASAMVALPCLAVAGWSVWSVGAPLLVPLYFGLLFASLAGVRRVGALESGALLTSWRIWGFAVSSDRLRVHSISVSARSWAGRSAGYDEGSQRYAHATRGGTKFDVVVHGPRARERVASRDTREEAEAAADALSERHSLRVVDPARVKPPEGRRTGPLPIVIGLIVVGGVAAGAAQHIWTADGARDEVQGRAASLGLVQVAEPATGVLFVFFENDFHEAQVNGGDVRFDDSWGRTHTIPIGDAQLFTRSPP